MADCTDGTNGRCATSLDENEVDVRVAGLLGWRRTCGGVDTSVMATPVLLPMLLLLLLDGDGP